MSDWSPSIGLLGQLNSFLESRKRIAGSTLKDLATNPMGLLNMLGHRAAGASKDLAQSAHARESVMPEMRQAGDDAMINFGANNGLLGMTAWHGSPHKFDKFDMSKIGTGEGAQAYGHGLYFAENPEVAGSYKSAGNKMAHSVKEMIENVQRKGSLYKVDIPDDQVAKMLDWDKPLSQQPEMLAKLKDHLAGMYMPAEHMTGNNIVKALEDKGWVMDKFGRGQAGVSAFLKSKGIPGIRYLDGGSRSGGKGTSNFVVFDDQIPKILGVE